MPRVEVLQLGVAVVALADPAFVLFISPPGGGLWKTDSAIFATVTAVMSHLSFRLLKGSVWVTDTPALPALSRWTLTPSLMFATPLVFDLAANGQKA